MYLLTQDLPRGRAAFGALLDALPIDAAPIHDLAVGGHRLLWSHVQPQENLHRFTDGVLLGKLAADEPAHRSPVDHDATLPTHLPPQLRGVVLRTEPHLSVEPIGITTAFWCGSSVSDRQLLLAAEAGLRPSAEGVAALSGVGYLPGNVSLFREVSRIPFLHRWAPDARTATRTRELALPRPDDDALVERLVSQVPTEVPHAVGLTGGFDSRFVLGLLRRAGATVRVLRFDDQEDDVVASIAAEAGVPSDSAGPIDAPSEHQPPGTFTVMTDGQLWLTGNQQGRLGRHLGELEWYHSGQFADSISKNGFKTAWKAPDPRTPFWPRLLATAMFPSVPDRRPLLRECNTRDDLLDLVLDAVAFEREYVELRTRKQWANWVHYMNRGLRWAQTQYLDLEVTSNPAFLLSDIDAQLLGIATSFWANFNNDRAKAMNHALLPEVTTPYLNGQPVERATGLAGARRKLEYEYVYRLRARRKGRAYIRSNTTTHETKVPGVTPAGWDDLFTAPMEDVAACDNLGLRRVAVIISHVLAFLESVPPPDPGPSPSPAS
jgi:hypothetical protein